MKSLEAARTDLHARHCKARNLHYLVHSNDLEVAYLGATSERKLVLLQLITIGDLTSIRRFIKKELLELTPFHRMSVSQLRTIGKRLRVENWYDLRKNTLVERIRDEVKRIKANSK